MIVSLSATALVLATADRAMHPAVGWLLVGYGLIVVLALLSGDSLWVVLALAPLLPFFLAWDGIQRLRGDPEARVHAALRRMQPTLRAIEPLLVRGHVPPGGTLEGRRVLVLSCAREADRPRLTERLPVLHATVLAELRARRFPEPYVARVVLEAASEEAIEEAGGARAYFH